jgi:serpin B
MEPGPGGERSTFSTISQLRNPAACKGGTPNFERLGRKEGQLGLGTMLKSSYVYWVVFAMSFSLAKGSGQSSADTNLQQLALANTGFAFRLLKELAHKQPGANVFISPYSISSVLQMISNGARGHTREELGTALGTTGLSPEEMNAAYDNLSHSISDTQSNVLLSIANALWYRTGAQLDAGFVTVNRKFYGATLSALDFSDPRSAQTMNDWAAQSTRGKIQTIIQPPISADTAIVLANAIYFKGTWLNPFDPKQTKPRAFHLNNGSDEPLPMMEQTRTFLYREGGGFQAVQLPYVGKRLQMQILLPETNSNVPAILGQLDATAWQNTVLPGFRENRGTLVLPRFKLRYGAELKSPLAALGLRSALSPGADFSAMSSSRLYLSKVKHQSFVEVNEEGTEAAAVTTGIMALASFRIEPQPFQMVVDRPFLFFISDQVTKSILFMGAVFDPGS